MDADVTKITTIEAGIEFFNEFVAGDYKDATGRIIHNPPIEL